MAKNLKAGRAEGQTPLDDLSGLLVPVKTREALNDLEAQNNAKAYAKYLLYTRAVESSNLLGTQMLCEIHESMFGEVWSWAGEIRKGGQKNIGVAAVKIGSELNRLAFEVHKWEDGKTSPAEIAIRVHHRLVWIHPFENGNGRWARLVTNLYLHRKGLPLIEWPSDPKMVREEFRPRYLAALKEADQDNYEALSELHRQYTK